MVLLKTATQVQDNEVELRFWDKASLYEILYNLNIIPINNYPVKNDLHFF